MNDMYITQCNNGIETTARKFSQYVYMCALLTDKDFHEAEPFHLSYAELSKLVYNLSGD